MKLSDTKIRRARAAGKRFNLSDGNGLVLRVTPTGQRTWVIVYRLSGKQTWLTVGTYPEMSLADARIRLLEVKQEVSAGRDPAATKSSAVTVNEIFEQYRNDVCAGMAEGTQGKINGTFAHHVLPAWGSRHPDMLRALDLALLVRKAAQPRKHGGRVVGGKGVSENVRKWVNHMWRWAKNQGLVETNPFADVPSTYKYTPRTRRLKLDEARAVWLALQDYGGYPFEYLFRLLMLTGARLGEIAQAKPNWLKTDALEIPATYTKTRAEQLIPLTHQMRDVIASLPREGDYLFTTVGNRPVSGFSTMRQRVRQLSGLDFNPHDLRRTMATEMQRMGLQPHVIEACLGHTLPGVQGVYRLYMYYDEKLAALQMWNDMLTGSQINQLRDKNNQVLSEQAT